MQTILVTGSNGFIGRHVCLALSGRKDTQVLPYDIDSPPEALAKALATCDAICHLAGVNRPQDPKEFETGNAGFTGEICDRLRALGRHPAIAMSSSIQAAADNPYGVSKRRAEEALAAFARDSGSVVTIFRLKNVFGKWCRPNYNSVVATFCHNIAHDLPVQISDPERALDLIFVDDVVDALVHAVEGGQGTGGRGQGTGDRGQETGGRGQETGDRGQETGDRGQETGGRGQGTGDRGQGVVYRDVGPSYGITLGDLAGRIQCSRDMQSSLLTPDFAVPFNRQLYSTYLSYLEPERWEYGLTIRADDRGSLAEFIKSPHFGQIFVSRTRPGVTRGNHYHQTKTEKFLVLAGEGVIRLRHIARSEIVEIRVAGDAYRVVDIPPGHTHNITNVGRTEMVTLFWASEIFNPDHADTFFLNV